MGMVNNYELKKELAENQLNIALEYNHLDYFLTGYAGLGIERINEDGTKTFDATFTVEAIHNYYRKNMESGIDKAMFTILHNIVSNSYDSESLANVLDVITIQILYEKNGHAAFTIDNIQLLEALKKHVLEYRDVFERRRINHFSSKSFAEYYDEVNDFLQNSLGK